MKTKSLLFAFIFLEETNILACFSGKDFLISLNELLLCRNLNSAMVWDVSDVPGNCLCDLLSLQAFFSLK